MTNTVIMTATATTLTTATAFATALTTVHLCHWVKGHEALQGKIMQGGFGGGMRFGWMDVPYKFLIPTSPQYIVRVFLYVRRKTTSKDIDCYIGAH
jgi:hypothetical protein